MPPSLKRIASTDRDISPPPAKRKVVATTTTKAVSNFFKPASEKPPEKLKFEVLHETLLVARYENATSTPRPKPIKIAAFDFDDTIVKTASGNRFGKDANDWKWWDASVPGKLKALAAEGYAVVVMSNQGAVSLRHDEKTPKTGMRSLNNIKGKITAVLGQLDLPITVYAATGQDGFRKPRTGMWEQLLRDYGLEDPGEINHAQCVFVGDAAGRPADKVTKTKKDHACSDRDLAANVDVQFQTPEEFFLGEESRAFERAFDPAIYMDKELSTDHEASLKFNKKHDSELVLFCGSPGAGKSTFYWHHLQPLGFERVNQDILKTRDKCLKTAKQLLEDQTSVVVDNTNADAETRAAWLKLAKSFDLPVRLVHFTAPAKLCEHNDTVRALSGTLMNPESRTMLPKMAFSGFASRYREPTLEEGFEDITVVDFAFKGTPEQQRVWRKFWVS
ncbi:hypothetical protein MBLNU230_g1524t1 [Neophaeotheca triangularis]